LRYKQKSIEQKDSFYVHRSLLSNKAPSLKIQTDGQNNLYAYIGYNYWGFHGFASRLYATEIDIDENNFDGLPHMLATRVDGTGLGRKVGCITYKDIMLDHFTDVIKVNEGANCQHNVIGPLLEEFPQGTGGWKFAVDYVIHGEVGYESGCLIYDNLRTISNEDFLIEVARKTNEIKGYNWIGRERDLEYCKIIVSSYCEQMRDMDDQKDEDIPWAQDKCHYHRHTALDLSCYAAKVDGR
jgi:hypothetical protein